MKPRITSAGFAVCLLLVPVLTRAQTESEVQTEDISETEEKAPEKTAEPQETEEQPIAEEKTGEVAAPPANAGRQAADNEMPEQHQSTRILRTSGRTKALRIASHITFWTGSVMVLAGTIFMFNGDRSDSYNPEEILKWVFGLALNIVGGALVIAGMVCGVKYSKKKKRGFYVSLSDTYNNHHVPLVGYVTRF